MTTKHTPGPWRIGDAGHTVFGPPNGEPAPKIIAGGLTRANARRIVACVNACEGINPEAVPDLLQACKAALAYMIDDKASDVSGERALSAIRAAIAKAEGRG